MPIPPISGTTSYGQSSPPSNTLRDLVDFLRNVKPDNNINYIQNVINRIENTIATNPNMDRNTKKELESIRERFEVIKNTVSDPDGDVSGLDGTWNETMKEINNFCRRH